MAHIRLISVFVVFSLTASQATRLQDWLQDRQQTDTSSQNNRQGTESADRKNTQPALSSVSSHAVENNLDCLPTQQKFVDNKIGDASLTISSPTHDRDMSICYNGRTDPNRQSCCTQTMERHYQQKSVNEYYKTLSSTSSYLMKLMSDNFVHYQDLFLSLLNGAHNKTERLFSEVYHLPLMDRWGPTESLFLDLQAHLKQQNVSIHQSVETFFDELFPLVFHNNVNDPSMSELNDDYRECLMQIRKDIYPPPFGGIPSKLSHQLSRSFGSARVFLEALKLGVRVINTTKHMPLEEGCKDALTRLQYCGHCDGFVDVAPCRGFCYNVMRGCFAHVTEMNIHWNEYIDALESLTVNLRGSSDIEEVLHSLHSKVSEAIMHAMVTGVKFNHKVRERCGQPQMRKSPADGDHHKHMTPPSQASLKSVLLPSPLEVNARLFAKIEMFMRNVIAAKGFFSHVPDTMCSEEKFSAGLKDSCWNGQNIAPYNKSIMTKDISAQLQNPEISILQKPHLRIIEITDELQTMKKLLSNKVNLEQMQGDSPQANYYNTYNQDYSQTQWGYGSGDWKVGYYPDNKGGGGPYYPGGGPMDDEDWYGSGSGAYGSGLVPGVRTSSRKPGHGGQPGGEFTFEGNEGSKTDPPYYTQKPGYSNEFVDPAGASLNRVSGMCLLIGMLCWILVI